MALSLNDYRRLEEIGNLYKSGELTEAAANVLIEALNPDVADGTWETAFDSAASQIAYWIANEPTSIPTS